MIKLHDFAKNLLKKKNSDENLNVEQKALVDLGVNRALRNIEEVVTQLQRNPPQLIRFAYELRKYDINDIYSYEFLNGQVHEHVLVEIFMANKWDVSKEQMVYDNRMKFAIHLGT